MMADVNKQTTLRELEQIPGVGKSIAEDLWNLGIRSIEELKTKDPEDLYLQHCVQMGGPVDRCILYVFRCANYYAAHERHDPALLKWWNWKDAKLK